MEGEEVAVIFFYSRTMPVEKMELTAESVTVGLFTLSRGENDLLDDVCVFD